jgi:hypothetical protein
MNYCPNCGERLPKPEPKQPLQPGLPIPPADQPYVPPWTPPWPQDNTGKLFPYPYSPFVVYC